MRKGARWTRLWLLGTLLLGAGGSLGCMSSARRGGPNSVIGHITPSSLPHE